MIIRRKLSKILILTLTACCQISLAQNYTQTHPLKVGVLLFNGFELLDATGPIEMLANVPKNAVSIKLIAEKKGKVCSDQTACLYVDYDFNEPLKLDILLIPGGIGVRSVLHNKKLLNWISKQATKVKTLASICTGAVLIAKTGLLDGKKATSNKAVFDWVKSERPEVNWQPKARWVESEKFVTASGVAAGIDMSLYLIEKYFGNKTSNKVAKETEFVRQPDSSSDPFSV